MPTPPYARVLIAKNGGAPASGAITVADGDTIQPSPESTAGWQSAPLWEIYSYPTGWGGPGGTWTYNASSKAYENTNDVPSSFVMSASFWGDYLWRLTADYGLPNTTGNQNLVDEATVLVLPDADTGLVDLGWLELFQVDSWKAWVGRVQLNLRTLATLLGIGATAKVKRVVTTNNTVTAAFTSATMAPSSSLKQVFMVEVLDEADAVKNFWVDDHWVRVGSAAPVRVGTSTGLRDISGSGTGDADPGFVAVGGLTNVVSGNTIVFKVQGANAHTHRWNIVPQTIVGT